MKVVVRPWGNFKQFTHNDKSTVKVIEVKPRQVLSLQYHHKRDELWYILDSGYIQVGKVKKRVKEGDIVKIPKKKLHRVWAGSKRMRFMEIATGNFSESDIVRVEDKYGRT